MCSGIAIAHKESHITRMMHTNLIYKLSARNIIASIIPRDVFYIAFGDFTILYAQVFCFFFIIFYTGWEEKEVAGTLL